MKALPWLLGAALLIGGGWYLWNLRAERDQALIAAHNAAAARDSLKLVWATDSARVYGRLAFLADSVAGLRRRLDSLGKSKAVTTVVVRPAPVNAEHRTAVVEGDSIRVTSDSLIGPPADVRATVTVFPGTASWAWLLRPTPIPLTVDVGCRGRLDPDVLVRAPAWVQLDSVGTVVATDVCGAPARKLDWKWPVLGGGALVALGLLLGLAVH